MRTIPDPQYYPTLLELAILVLAVGELLAIGYLAKRFWERRGETLPPTFALSLWVLLIFAWAGVLGVFYSAAPEVAYIEDPFKRAGANLPVDPRMRHILWTFAFWLLPMGYYINLLRHSFATYAVDHIGPFSGAIEDPSEFADARRLALRGDVNGAVAKYRSYEHNKSQALFEAARLLKSEDRFSEAAELFEEVMRANPGNRKVWAEACYQLAKVYETGFNNAQEAKRLLRALLQRAPETRFGALASADLVRLQTLEEMVGEVDEAEAADIADVPGADYDDTEVHVDDEEDVEDDGVVPPPVDPFFAARNSRKQAAKIAAHAGITNFSADEEPAAPAARPRKTAASKSAPAEKPLPRVPAASKVGATTPGVPKVAAKKPAARKALPADTPASAAAPAKKKAATNGSAESPKATAKKPAAKKKPAV
jgi:tetratricopeptide (TPR) repeat protein